MALSFDRSLAAGLVVLAPLLAAPVASAAPMLIGDSVLIEFRNTGFGDFSDAVVVGAGVEIAQGDGSDIGDNGMTGTEFVDIGALSVGFGIFGGFEDDVVSEGPPRYLGTGLDPAAEYHISGLFDPLAARIVGVSVSSSFFLTTPTVLFDEHSITLLLGGAGILESAQNLGFVTVNLQVEELNPPPIPEPGTLLLLGAGALAGARRMRTRSMRA